MTKTFTAQQIATEINNAGEKHYGDSARGWDADKAARVYFGRDFVVIDVQTGEVHNRKAGAARALTIGASAVDLVNDAIERLAAK